MRPYGEEIARDYELWVKYVHDEIPDGEFYEIASFRNLATVSEKLSRVRFPPKV